MNIAFYITGHGFGHAARSIEIIRSLSQSCTDIKFYLRTSVPEWFFEDSLKDKAVYDYHKEVVDIGVVQKDALHLDKRRTLETFSQFWDSREKLIYAEVKDLSVKNIDLVISDIAPVAFLIAKKLNVPSIAISNFTWSYIYKDYVKKHVEYSFLINEINSAYSNASFALRYPFHGDFSCFKVVYDIGLVGRKSEKDKNEILNALGINSDKKIILIAFGGFDVDSDFIKKMNLSSDYYIIDAQTSKRISQNAGNLTLPDLVSIASAVVTKPGYGIVSECILAKTPMLYTSRGHFAEYGKLVRGMKKYIPVCFIPQKVLFAGNIKPYLQKLFSEKPKKVSLSTNGIVEARERILKCLKNTY